VFAYSDTGIPDGIKCDTLGNVYSGCGDGLNVWSPGGFLLGKVRVPGGVANFCFGRPGELFLLNENKFWVLEVARHVKGALLEGMGIEASVQF
jgi:gluconolactonase